MSQNSSPRQYDTIPIPYWILNHTPESFVNFLLLSFVICGPVYFVLLVPLNWHFLGLFWHRCIEQTPDVEESYREKYQSIQLKLKVTSGKRNKLLLQKKDDLEMLIRTCELSETHEPTRAYKVFVLLFRLVCSVALSYFGWPSIVISALLSTVGTKKEFGLFALPVEFHIRFIELENSILHHEKNAKNWNEFHKWLKKNHTEFSLEEYAMQIIAFNNRGKTPKEKQSTENIQRKTNPTL